MRILNFQQGSPEWHDFRAKHFTASDAPAVMGASPYKTRADLLREKATGVTEEVTPQKQALFDKGHAAEAAARPMAEEIIGEDLYPVVAEDDEDPRLGASFDGVTMGHRKIWEHKLYNEAKAVEVAAGRVPEADYWQVVHQLMLSGADECLYMVSDGTPDKCEHVTVTLDPDDIPRLLAAWYQFEDDLKTYDHQPAEVEAVGRTMKDLPALHIELTGMVTESNLGEFRETALAVLDGINTDLQTDQDFADAEETAKWCKDVEKRIDATKGHALAQTASIDDLFKTLDEIREETRRRRLELEKQVKAQKDQRRAEIKQAAEQALADHIRQLEANLEPVRLPEINADVAGAIKGKRSLSAIKDAADDAVAKAKIEANEIAERIRANLRRLDEEAGDYRFLFSDLQQIVGKAPDDFAALMRLRIADHEKAEEKRLEAEREKIRAEERAAAEPKQEPSKAPGCAPEGDDLARITQRLTEAMKAIEADAEWMAPENQRKAQHVTDSLRAMVQDINQEEAE